MVTDGNRTAEECEARLDVHGSEPAFNDDGVDLTLIRRALAMTPLERVSQVEAWARAIRSARIVDAR